MSAPVIHPENLLEKFTDGALTPNEHELLQEHLAACAACRFELLVRADLETEAEVLEFDRVTPGQLLLASPESRSLEQQLPQAAPAPLLGAAPPIRRRSLRRTLAITAAALGLASGAAALVATQTPQTSRTLDITRPVVQQRAVGVQRIAKSRPAHPEPEEAPAPSAPPPVLETDELARQQTTPTAPRNEPAAASADDALTSAQLFSQANQARRASDPARATQLYRLLQRKFPGSKEAQLSLVTLGSLQLNGGNAAGALATFNRYLRSGGRSLEAEALYGQAQALRRLGRTGEERRTWERLLARHPGSGYAPQARERLDSLGGS